MDSKMRRNLAGRFLTRNLGVGAWQLSRTEPGSIDVFLRGTEPDAAEILSSPGIRDIDIEWQGPAVMVTMTSAERRRSIKAQSAIVHEPQTQLYEALPLVVLDDKARRFWRRVFRLVRIPGGRHLLGILARRTRK
jgi:hypothetical protein